MIPIAKYCIVLVSFIFYHYDVEVMSEKFSKKELEGFSFGISQENDYSNDYESIRLEKWQFGRRKFP